MKTPTYCWKRKAKKRVDFHAARDSALHRRTITQITLFVIALVQCLVIAASFAQSPSLGITVIPPIPSAQALYQIRVTAITIGGPLTIEDIVTTTSGATVDITYYIHHGSTNAIAVPYQGTTAGPPLAAGTYEFRHYARIRVTTETTYRDPVLVYQKAVTVAPPGALTDAVEYYHAHLDHYFTTAFASEIALLDSGAVSGWSRTGETLPGVFLVNPTAVATLSELTAVCRFYGKVMPLLGTHFYSAFPAECDAVSAMWPTQWLLETPNAYFVYPTTINGQCPLGTVSVYRLYNGRPDVNHRYTTSATTRDAMIGEGWIAEGAGPDGVAMCTTGPVPSSN